MKDRLSFYVIGMLLLAASTSVVGDVQLGPRPFYLVNAMNEGELKEELLSCASGPFKPSNFSIAHRGAPLQFPEHTKESYMAAARMGAGVIECDVTFTSDRELVCRHSQCDLHTTTNILSVPELAAKCTKGFDPAVIDKSTGELIKPASARCCTSDITLEEFLSLEGKMDASNSRALSVDEFQAGTASFRTDLYSGKGTLMTHAESIVLFESLGVGMTPELKAAAVNMPYKGYTQKEYAQQLIDEYIAAGISPNRVWPQSFNLDDVRYWIDNTPEFGMQAIYLDGRYRSNEFDPLEKSSWKPTMSELRGYGVSTIAPPIWVLLQLNDGAIVPSTYARAASDAGLDIISWTLERSGLLASGGGWYYQSVKDVINNDGDVYSVLDVLAQDVGVVGVFSDWPATVTYYANCMDL